MSDHDTRLAHIQLLGRLGAAHEHASDAVAAARRRLDTAIAEAAVHLSTREIADIVGQSHETVAVTVRRIRNAGRGR